MLLRGLLSIEDGGKVLPFVRMFFGQRSIFLWEDEVGDVRHSTGGGGRTRRSCDALPLQPRPTRRVGRHTGTTMTTFGPHHFWPAPFFASSRSDHCWPAPLLAQTTFFDQTVLCPNFCEIDPRKSWPMGLLFGICCSCLVFWAMDLPAPPNTSLQPPLCCVVCRGSVNGGWLGWVCTTLHLHAPYILTAPAHLLFLFLFLRFLV